MVIAPDRPWLATTSADGTARIWAAENKRKSDRMITRARAPALGRG